MTPGSMKTHFCDMHPEGGTGDWCPEEHRGAPPPPQRRKVQEGVSEQVVSRSKVPKKAGAPRGRREASPACAEGSGGREWCPWGGGEGKGGFVFRAMGIHQELRHGVATWPEVRFTEDDLEGGQDSALLSP